MSKILVFGTSHVGALKQGLDQTQAISDSLQFDFAALPVKCFKKFRLVNSEIRASGKAKAALTKTYSHGPAIDLNSYDRIVFVHGLCRLDFSLYFHDRRIAPRSETLIRDIALHPRDPSLFLSLVEALPPAKIIYIGSPLISEKATKKKHAIRVPSEPDKSQMKQAAATISIIREACRDSERDASIPSFLLPPPEILNATGFNTQDRFIRGGARFDGRIRTQENDSDYNKDMVHGNAEYGKVMAKILLNHLKQLATIATAPSSRPG